MANTNTTEELLTKILERMVEKATTKNFKGVAAIGLLDEKNVFHFKAKDCGKMFAVDCNCLALAFSKIAEMADTLKDSGSHVRPVLHGEFGYVGGAVKVKNEVRYFAAFSGAASEEDLEVSRYGLEIA